MRILAKFNVSTYSELERVLQQVAEDALNKVTIKVEKMIKKYVMDKLYNSYTPTDYIRSYDYLESLTVTKVTKNSLGELETKIFFDPNKIHSRETEGSYWNQHMSINGDTTWEGKPISEWIPVFIEYGTKGSLWDRKGIHVVDNIMKELDRDGKYKKFMASELKRMGLDAK